MSYVSTTIASGLSKIYVGLGWQAPAGEEYDLDATCFLLGANGKTRNQNDCIYFNQLKTPDGSVLHYGDNLEGGGGGDDERIDVNLAQLPADVEKLVFVVSIYGAEEHSPKQTFGQVENSYIRIVDQNSNAEIARFDPRTDGRAESVIVFGELYKENGAWFFRSLGDAFDGTLAELAQRYGVVVA